MKFSIERFFSFYRLRGAWFAALLTVLPALSFASDDNACRRILSQQAVKELSAYRPYRKAIAEIDRTVRELDGLASRLKALNSEKKKGSAPIYTWVQKNSSRWGAEREFSRALSVKAETRRLEGQITLLEERFGALNLLKQHLETRLADTLAKDLELIEKNPEIRSDVNNLFNYRLLFNLPSWKMASFVWGASPLPETAKGLLQELRDKGYLVLYDADQPSASVIAEIVGTRGLGISAHRKDDRIFRISDDYLRMETLSLPNRVITSPDSAYGAGLLLMERVSVVLDDQAQFATGHLDWAKGLRIEERDHNTGVWQGPFVAQSLEDIQTLATSAGDPFFSSINSPAEAPLPSNPLKTHFRDIFESLEYAKVKQKAFEPDIQGVVVFGSGGNDHRSDGLLFDVATRIASRGVSLTTGGAGGAMKVTNVAAYLAGAESIGIPHASHPQETRVYEEAHTLTIYTPDYPIRIPTLLKNKQIIVNAPGGRGTLREIAAAFFSFAKDPTDTRQMIFLDSKYYGSLFNWLQNLPLPSAILNRLHLADSAETAMQIVEPTIQTHPTMVQTSNVVPRSIHPGTLSQHGPETKRWHFFAKDSKK